MSAESCAIRGGRLYIVRGLKDDEFSRAKDAAAAVSRFSDNQHHFRMVEKSYEEFNAAVGGYAENFANPKELTYFQVMDQCPDANRLLLNFLAIMNTFVEHSTIEVKRDFGKDSENVRAFEEAKSAAYNGTFAYRFLWRLRNYAIHISPPLKPDMHLRDAGSDEPDPRLSYYPGRKELLNGRFDWPRRINGIDSDHWSEQTFLWTGGGVVLFYSAEWPLLRLRIRRPDVLPWVSP